MNAIHKFIGSFTAVAMFCLIATCTQVSATERKWQELYIEVIENRPEKAETSTSSSYLLYNIDDDEIPELLIWDSSKYIYALYTCYDGETVLCDEFSNKNMLLFYPLKGCFWSSVTEYAKLIYSDFYRLDDGSCTKLYSFCHDLSDEENGIYKINGKVVSREEYENKMAELEAEYPMSWEEFMINGKLEYNYDEIIQYLLNSMEEQTVDVTTTSVEDATNPTIVTTGFITTSETATTVIQTVSDTTEVSFTSDFIETSETSTTTVSAKNPDATLPQTGLSNWYKLIILIAVGILGVGAFFIKFGLQKRNNK